MLSTELWIAQPQIAACVAHDKVYLFASASLSVSVGWVSLQSQTKGKNSNGTIVDDQAHWTLTERNRNVCQKCNYVMQCFRFDFFFFIFDEMLWLLFLCVFGFYHCTTMSKTELMTAIMQSQKCFFLTISCSNCHLWIFTYFIFFFVSRSVGNRIRRIDLSISWAVEWSELSISIEQMIKQMEFHRIEIETIREFPHMWNLIQKHKFTHDPATNNGNWKYISMT